MAKSWNFLQELVFNFGAELSSNPTQYMMERAFEKHGLNWRYVQFEFQPETLKDAEQIVITADAPGGGITGGRSGLADACPKAAILRWRS